MFVIRRGPVITRAISNTFWDYRVKSAMARKKGWRVDHILATAPLAEKSSRSWIDIGPRLEEKPSDHTPIVAEFDI